MTAISTEAGKAPFVEVIGLRKTYLMEERVIEVLTGVDLTIRAGEMLALTGASGVGKSTFLHLLGALDPPTAGSIRFDGVEITALPDSALASFRNRMVGFVFQSHHLLPEFTALENVMMPALIQRMEPAKARARASDLLASVGLSQRGSHKPGELSGGEQQRVALARALVLQPRMLLADEPTGNLDPATGEEIHQLLAKLNASLGITVLVVTHNEQYAASMPRGVKLEDGKLHERGRSAP